MTLAWQLAVGIGAALAALAIHEAGHLVGGALVGFRPVVIAVGPGAIVRAGRRFQFRWLPPSHWGPVAMAVPTTTERLRFRVACMVAGGPVASLAVAGALYVLAFATGPSLLKGMLMFVSVLSACIFVATVQPFGTGIGLPSDGARVWYLLRNRDAAKFDLAVFTLAGLTHGGVRPREWEKSVVDWMATRQPSPAYELAAATAALCRAADLGDDVAANAQLQRLRAVYARVPRMLRADSAAEAAFWSATSGNDLAAAREFLRDAGGTLAEPYRRWTAEAAVRAAADDREGARAALARARASLSQGLGTPSALDRERIARLESAL
jgi:hypothetical protein